MSLLCAELDTILGSYQSGTASKHLADAAHLQATRLRRRQLSRMTTALDLPTATKRLPETDYAISRKVDGEFTCLLFEDGEAITLNPGGIIRAGAPFHEEAAKLLSDAGIKRAMLGGELHARRTDGKRSRVHDVASAARAPKTQEQIDSLCFAIFNIYDIDGNDLSMHYVEAIARAQEIFGDGDRVFPVETHIGDKNDAIQWFETWVTEQGEEGIVLRSDSAGVYKIKPRHSLDLAIIGYSEGVDDRAGMLHSMLLAVARDTEHAQIVARVGGGFSDEDRVNLLETLKQHDVSSDYAEVNSDRVAYRMIKPGLVIEVSCLDVIAQTSHGSAIDKMVIEWQEEKQNWQGVRRLPLCSIISPQYVRMRDDKTFNPDDCGVQQLSDIVDIPDTKHGKLDSMTLPTSKVIDRSVATKVLKEATMVRKILLWQTNKQEASREFPAFVLHLTDYSPNRKQPLNHEICVSDSETQIRKLFSEWEEEYFVRGWKPVEQ